MPTASGEKFLSGLKSYLTNRTLYVQYGNSKSETKTITHGVPQSSSLRPLLLILCVKEFLEPRIYYFLFYLPMILL